MKFKILLLITCLGIFSCNKQPLFKNGSIITDQAFINNLQTQAVDTLQIDSTHYILDASLWRDFMPASPRKGSPLMASNTLINIDTVSIPANLDLVKQYVIYNNSVWVADYSDKTPGTPAFRIEKISRKGPKWGPQVYVDVIAKIHNAKTGDDYYLQKKQVYITRTD